MIENKNEKIISVKKTWKEIKMVENGNEIIRSEREKIIDAQCLLYYEKIPKENIMKFVCKKIGDVKEEEIINSFLFLKQTGLLELVNI